MAAAHDTRSLIGVGWKEGKWGVDAKTENKEDFTWFKVLAELLHQ